MKIQEEFGSFSSYIWKFTDGKPIHNNRKSLSEIPATTPLSDTISKDLKKRGFKFAGSTVVYAHMQATGMVNDHVEDCLVLFLDILNFPNANYTLGNLGVYNLYPLIVLPKR